MALALLSLPAPETPPAPAPAAPVRDGPVEARVQPVAALISSDGWVAPTTPTRQVAERFFRDHGLEALALVHLGRPVGLITRPRLLLKLARGFGHELYARKPIARVADGAPLVVAADAGVVTTVAAALDRAPEGLYDEVIVVDGAGRYLGLLSVRALVLQQGLALARSAAERASAEARAADLEQLDRLRARFLAHATHELRSPVNVVVGVAELVRRHAEKGAWNLVAERLPMLQRSAATLRTTVNNILDLSKLEAGKAEVVVGPVELGPMLEDVAGMARLLAGDKPLAVVVDDGAAPAEFATDGLKLRQILTNLASNAVKFTEGGRVTLGAAAAPDGLRLWIADTGIGIRQEDLARLFTPFGQLSDASSRQQEGTGLGLVITRSMVQLLGGRVEVESRHGHGSTFTVHLPRAKEAPSPP